MKWLSRIAFQFRIDVLDLARKSGRMADFKIISDQIYAKKKQTKFTRIKAKVEAYIRGARANG